MPLTNRLLLPTISPIGSPLLPLCNYILAHPSAVVNYFFKIFFLYFFGINAKSCETFLDVSQRVKHLNLFHKNSWRYVTRVMRRAPAVRAPRKFSNIFTKSHKKQKSCESFTLPQPRNLSLSDHLCHPPRSL